MIKVNTLRGYMELLDHYYLDDNLRIVSAITGKAIATRKNNSGYISCNLTRKDRKRTTALIHRVIAEACVENAGNLPEVNHKDEDKTNNHPSNLEWCTHKYNCRYGTRNERVGEKTSKPVKQISLSGQVVAVYPNAKLAARALGLKSSNSVRQCILGIKPTGGGYRWDYA